MTDEEFYRFIYEGHPLFAMVRPPIKRIPYKRPAWLVEGSPEELIYKRQVSSYAAADPEDDE